MLKFKIKRLTLLICFFVFSHGVTQAAPPLPSGLNNKPVLPSGLKPSVSPALPSGLSNQSENKFNQFDTDEPFINVSGFFDMRGGIRTQNDPNQRQLSLGETRLQIALQKEIGSVSVNLITDVLYDATVNSYDIALDKGRGWIDLREANFAFSPFSFMDLKVGRQVLTWGTGDLIFINDLFPKDWQAFFTGRDLKYLKAPSDSVKSSFFSDYGNVDFVYTPWFDADRGITGEKISFYSPNTGTLVGNSAIITPERPYSEEFAMRIYKNIGVNELALYGYHGFWKSPVGFNTSTGNPRYPKMRSLGASIRRPVWQGIANIEVGYYDSYEKSSSSNPFTPNSEARFLIGYEQEVVKNFSVGMQYYVEWMQDYKHYQAAQNSIGATVLRDEVRHLITNRLTLMTHQQNVIWSLFTFYSPSDQDAYFRPKVAYKVTDAWQVEMGGNFFVGSKQSTFFGQFEKNNNIFGSIRYSF
ncbi:MAG: hypothetical protein KAT04_09280 [Methylococcales bacterium]|nr:hypothetical protein [Methylococcales bacterium]